MKFKIVKTNQKVSLVKSLIRELDDLYEDLTYELTEEDFECVKSKITIRENMLKQLGSL